MGVGRSVTSNFGVLDIDATVYWRSMGADWPNAPDTPFKLVPGTGAPLPPHPSYATKCREGTLAPPLKQSES